MTIFKSEPKAKNAEVVPTKVSPIPNLPKNQELQSSDTQAPPVQPSAGLQLDTQSEVNLENQQKSSSNAPSAPTQPVANAEEDDNFCDVDKNKKLAIEKNIKHPLIEVLGDIKTIVPNQTTPPKLNEADQLKITGTNDLTGAPKEAHMLISRINKTFTSDPPGPKDFEDGFNWKKKCQVLVNDPNRENNKNPSGKDYSLTKMHAVNHSFGEDSKVNTRENIFLGTKTSNDDHTQSVEQKIKKYLEPKNDNKQRYVDYTVVPDYSGEPAYINIKADAIIKPMAQSKKKEFLAWAKQAIPQKITITPVFYEMEKTANNGSAAATKSETEQPNYIEKTIREGAKSAVIKIPVDANKKTKTQKDMMLAIKESNVNENKKAANLISGLQLNTMTLSENGSSTIQASFDEKQLPITLTGQKSSITLQVSNQGEVNLPPLAKTTLPFKYNFFASEGSISQLSLSKENAAVSGAGTLKSKIKFIPQVNFTFDNDNLTITEDLNKKIQSPIPGLTFTKAAIGLKLAPIFEPTGNIEFKYNLPNKSDPLLDGALSLSAGVNGFKLDGDINGHIPGIDNAKGHFTYQNNKWLANFTAEANQLKKKFPVVDSGKVNVNIADGLVQQAEGTIRLLIPGTQGVDATLSYEKSKWVFKGQGQLDVPKLKSVPFDISYDGEKITGTASANFKFHGLDGRMNVNYDGKNFSGKGKISIEKNRAKGSLDVELQPNHKFSGKGAISYQLTDSLTGSVGVKIDENEKVILDGALKLTKPIHLFNAVNKKYNFFNIQAAIPIPGLSIGNAGVNATVSGGLSFGYHFGPGEIRNVELAATFNPLADTPDDNLDMLLQGEFYISMGGNVEGHINGGIKLEALAGRVGGELAVSAGAGMGGEMKTPVQLHYQKGHFTAEANFSLLLDLILNLSMHATIYAEGGWGWLSVRNEKVWDFFNLSYPVGKFGMALKEPVRYDSMAGLKLPSLDAVQWTVPKIDSRDILKSLFSHQNPQPKAIGR